jgi:diguanylate cyclase (GGDEF)-like protein
MNEVVPTIDLLVAAIATATIAILRDVAVLAPSTGLKRAWWTLGVMLGLCVLLLLVHAWCAAGQVASFGDLVGVAIFLVGVCFIYAVAWLSRRTARDMLRVQDMARHAYRDPLTGLGNRRRFAETLDAAVADAGRTGQHLCLVAVDIDHFKAVNDTHGHAAGDEVLRRVAAIMAAQLRPVDTACRVGGEEFAVIVRDLDPRFAAALAERLRDAVASLRMEVAGERLRVTISLGLAVLAVGEDSAALLGRADAALYAAKRGGRDQLRLAA